MNKLKRNSQGFTIIEVLIVLAIAGLILLIVFLAVPALQRNSRNTSRKNDAGRVGAAASEFLSNNNSTVPTNSAADLAEMRSNIGTLSQYNVNTDLGILAGTQAAINNLNQIRLVTGAQCAANGATTNVGVSTKQMVVQWGNETSGTPQGLCQNI